MVDLDKKKMSIKILLKKELECTVCRNMRISKEIDSMNKHYDDSVHEDEGSFC